MPSAIDRRELLKFEKVLYGPIGPVDEISVKKIEFMICPDCFHEFWATATDTSCSRYGISLSFDKPVICPHCKYEWDKDDLSSFNRNKATSIEEAQNSKNPDFCPVRPRKVRCHNGIPDY